MGTTGKGVWVCSPPPVVPGCWNVNRKGRWAMVRVGAVGQASESWQDKTKGTGFSWAQRTLSQAIFQLCKGMRAPSLEVFKQRVAECLSGLLRGDSDTLQGAGHIQVEPDSAPFTICSSREGARTQDFRNKEPCLQLVSSALLLSNGRTDTNTKKSNPTYHFSRTQTELDILIHSVT